MNPDRDTIELELTGPEIELVLKGLADLEARKDEWDVLIDSIRAKLGQPTCST